MDAVSAASERLSVSLYAVGITGRYRVVATDAPATALSQGSGGGAAVPAVWARRARRRGAVPIHVVMDSQDPEAIEPFWCELLGMQVVTRLDGGRHVVLRSTADGFMLGIQ